MILIFLYYILVPSYTKREYMTAEPIAVGETFHGMVTCLEVPSAFYVQPVCFMFLKNFNSIVIVNIKKNIV